MPISPILFLVYISKIFSHIEEKLTDIIYVSFINNLGFLTFGYTISIMGKLLEKAGKIVLEWMANNSVTYDISKTEVVLFSQAYHQKLVKQILET